MNDAESHRVRPGLRLGARMTSAVAALASLALVLGALGIWSARESVRIGAEIEHAGMRTALAERMNALIFAAVMDSRGVYMSSGDPTALTRFADGLVGQLKRMEDVIAEWKALIPPERMDAFAEIEGGARQFITFRHRLADFGFEGDAAAARSWGDNEQNRSVRQALNRLIQAQAETEKAILVSAHAKMNQRVQELAVALAIIGLIGAVGVWFVHVKVVRAGLVKPLRQVAVLVEALADGGRGLQIDHRHRGDEIGDITRALVVLQEALVKGEEADAERLAGPRRRTGAARNSSARPAPLVPMRTGRSPR